MKRRGFTLGEILITLTIVGVVAILIVPSLVSDINEKGRMELLKGTMSDLNNAVQSYMIKNHMTDLTDLTVDDEKGVPFIVEYTYDEDGNLTDTKEALALKKNKSGDVMRLDFTGQTYKSLSGASTFAATFAATYTAANVYLNNGAAVAMKSTQSTCSDKKGYELFIDVNGTEPPNIIGMDVFVVFLPIEKDSTYSMPVGQFTACSEANMNACKTGSAAACYYQAENSGFNPAYYK